jgi:hypothetical protein
MITRRLLRGIRLCALPVLVVIAHALPARSAVSGQTLLPSIRFVTAPGYTLALSGKGWGARANVRIIVRAGNFVGSRHVRVTRTGQFLLGVSVSLCAGAQFDVFSRSHHATIHSPGLACALRVNPPAPQMIVLRGQLGKTSETRAIDPQITGSPLTLRVGDTLYLWEPGTTRPLFTPGPDPSYLAQVAQGTTPPRACAQTDCAAGFYWRWLALRPGQTGIRLEPACRLSKPQCELPDRILEVTIIP